LASDFLPSAASANHRRSRAAEVDDDGDGGGRGATGKLARFGEGRRQENCDWQRKARRLDFQCFRAWQGQTEREREAISSLFLRRRSAFDGRFDGGQLHKKTP